MVFNVSIVNGQLVSEDVTLCKKLTAAGFDIFLNASMTCDHSGSKTWSGDCAAWLEKLREFDKKAA